jgi:hypothetical protein
MDNEYSPMKTKLKSSINTLDVECIHVTSTVNDEVYNFNSQPET